MTNQNKIKNLSVVRQYLKDNLEEDSTYLFLEKSVDGSTYAYYMSTGHIQSVLNNKYEDEWASDCQLVTQDQLDHECNLESYDAPFIHIVKVK